VFGGSPSAQAAINHGTYFYHAHQRGLLANDSNIHVGIRTTLSGMSDYDNDGYCGFEIVEAREIDTIGTAGIIKKVLDRVGTEKPVYLSIDIDTLDPACKFKALGFTAFLTSMCQMLPPLVPPKLVDGRRENSAR
jgi:agmatinase